MSLGIFDLIGPIMMGPSSSHTAGATRIGYLARLLTGGEPERITLGFHSGFMETYAGHRTHWALAAGLLGYREDDPAGAGALDELGEKGIDLGVMALGTDVHRNAMQVNVVVGGIHFLVEGVSVGGGAIRIQDIDGVAVNLDGSTHILLCRSKGPIKGQVGEGLNSLEIAGFFEGKTEKDYLSCWSLVREPSGEHLTRLSAAHEVKSIPPLYPYRKATKEEPLFSRFSRLEELAPGYDDDLGLMALEYEVRRTGEPEGEIVDHVKKHLSVMEESINRGLSGEEKPLGGFCSGRDSSKMAEAFREKRTITGGILGSAMARALAVVEVNAALGRIAASPTAGGAGVVPGVLFSIKDRYKKTEGEMTMALLAAGAVGVCIANKASLSGAVGGCQGEIGIGSAMAAGAAVYLAGGGVSLCCHAAALSLKNLLGLVCDPPAGPVEVPCIKRNAVGAAVALAAADMSLAGIRSAIPPDEVVDALCNVQEHLPQILKGSGRGGLGCTRTGEWMKEEWRRKLETLR